MTLSSSLTSSFETVEPYPRMESILKYEFKRRIEFSIIRSSLINVVWLTNDSSVLNLFSTGTKAILLGILTHAAILQLCFCKVTRGSLRLS